MFDRNQDCLSGLKWEYGAVDLDEELKRLQLKQLQHDTNWTRWSIPAASVIFSAATIFLSIETAFSDSKKSEHDHALACATFAASETSIISNARTVMQSMSEDQKYQYISAMVAAFPPDAAKALSDGLAQQLGSSSDALDFINTVNSVNKNFASELAPYSIECKTISDFFNGNPYVEAQTTH